MQTDVNLNSRGSIADTVRLILNEQLRLMKANAGRVIHGPEVRAVHDLRLAVRRFRIALKFFGEWVPGPMGRRLRRQLLIVNRRLGPIRDAQVWQTRVKRSLRRRKARLPANVALCVKGAEDACMERCQALGPIVNDIPFREAGDCVNRISGENPAGPIMAGTLLRAYKQLCRNKHPLAGLTGEEEHAFRRHCRRVRYLFEFSEPLLGGTVQKLSNRLKRVSNALGARHDAEVQARLLVDMTVPPDALLRKVASGKLEARQDFDEGWRKLRAPHFRKRVVAELRAAMTTENEAVGKEDL